MSDGLVLVRASNCSSPPPLAALNQPELPPAGTLVGLDFETRGTNAAASDFRVVGAGVAWQDASGDYVARYIGDSDEIYSSEFVNLISSYNCVAHNQLFDSAALTHIAYSLGLPTPVWTGYCTYGLYRQLASEGHPGQRWGLKQAEVELLGWPESNEKLLHKWLTDNGYTRGRGRAQRADPSEMWRAPASILGPYCCLDAVATLQLYNDVFNPLLDRFPQLRAYHQREFIGENYLLVRQLFDGVYIDRTQLESYSESLDYEIGEADRKFRRAVAPYLAEYNAAQIQTVLDKEPSRYRKDGRESKLWQNWEARVELARATDHFNINSNKQLQWLFYDKLGHPVRLRTDSGQPAVNTKALGLFGSTGALLREYNEYAKEQGYVEAVLNRLVDTDELHLQFRNPGTLTERLAGGGSRMYKVEITTEDLDSAGVAYHIEKGTIIIDE